eukprot:sb/3468059/
MALRRCITPARSYCTRFLSNTSDQLVNLDDIHREWKNSGLQHPRLTMAIPLRAPARLKKHGAMFLERSLVHAGFGKQLGDKINRLKPVEVTFGDKVVDFGTIITPTQALQPPTLDLSTLGGNDYTVTMTTPDSPDCRLHWCISGDATLQPYIPPTPLRGTGFYRYLISVYQGTIREKGEVASLPLVGCVHFQCSWDESVGRTLARDLGVDEKVYVVQRSKKIEEDAAERLFKRREWEMKTEFISRGERPSVCVEHTDFAKCCSCTVLYNTESIS